MTAIDLREELDAAALHFPAADPKIARSQALRLIKAKRRLAKPGKSAVVVGSTFKYKKAGIVAQLFARTDHAAMLAELVEKINAGRETLADVSIEYLRSPSPMTGNGDAIGRRITITLKGA